MSSKNWPASLVQYQELFDGRTTNLELRDVRFVVFDTETSGLSPKSSKLLSLAAVSIHNQQLQLSDSFEVCVAQDDVGGQAAAPIHGLVPQELMHGMSAMDAVLAFLTYVGSAVLVAHHTRFDLAVVNRVLSAYPGAKVMNPWLDTGRLVARFEHGVLSQHVVPRMGLDEVLTRYDVEMGERHTAPGDALATAILFLRVLRMAETRGVYELRALLQRW